MAKRISVSDYRRLTRLAEALAVIKEEIDPAKPEDLDEYDQKKLAVNKQVAQLKKGLHTLQKLQDSRDVVEHKMKLREQFLNINKGVEEFGVILTKMAKKRTKDKQALEARLKAGQEWMKSVREELMRLAQEAKSVDLSGTGIDVQQNARDQRKEERKKNKKRRRKADDGEDWGDGVEMVAQAGEASEKEQAFMQKVEQARQQEEEMLQLIIQGLTELHTLATTLNKLLKQQQMLIDDVEERIDRVQEKLDGNNKRLDKVLEKTGGMVRFIPFLICGMFILAIVVFAYSRIK